VDALRDAVLAALDGVVDGLEVGCGVGTLSLPLARGARSWVGVDEVRQAVDDATFNAARAGVGNARFRVGRADHALRRLAAGGARPDGVLLHAMRRPFGAAAMSALQALGPARVAYVAPSARSLAADLAALPRYRLARLRLLDQMPGTAHFTTLAILERA
jgi:tRNA/tmRNA/rRNA uracil-C5-methylase (TrmA/RlmC/RlmD family)